MEEMDYWRLCEDLNIVQAAMLVVGEDPSCAKYIEDWEVENRPKGYEAAKTAISAGLKNFVLYRQTIDDLESQSDHLRVEHRHAPDMVQENAESLSALLRRSIEGELMPKEHFDINGNHAGYQEGSIDVYRSLVKADSLRDWLKFKGVKSGFFFPEPVETLDFLEPTNPRYAPKLAAAVRAWQAVTDPGKKSPKQALDKWLREHAAEYGMTNDEGQPIENAIEECSKVANWNPKGGATKTPT